MLRRYEVPAVASVTIRSMKNHFCSPGSMCTDEKRQCVDAPRIHTSLRRGYGGGGVPEQHLSQENREDQVPERFSALNPDCAITSSNQGSGLDGKASKKGELLHHPTEFTVQSIRRNSSLAMSLVSMLKMETSTTDAAKTTKHAVSSLEVLYIGVSDKPKAS